MGCGLNNYVIQVVDLNGCPVHSGLSVVIQNTDGSPATVWTDERMKNSVSIITPGVGGAVRFFGDQMAYQLRLVRNSDFWYSVSRVTPIVHKIVFEPDYPYVSPVLFAHGCGASSERKLCVRYPTDPVTVFNEWFSLSSMDVNAISWTVGDIIHVRIAISTRWGGKGSGYGFEFGLNFGDQSLFRSRTVADNIYGAGTDLSTYHVLIDAMIAVEATGSSAAISMAGATNWTKPSNSLFVSENFSKSVVMDMTHNPRLKTMFMYPTQYDENSMYVRQSFASVIISR